ncbi:MAG TPA: family 10 glycosylhydrolase [Bryobacteraceae bacterium]|nr:family 10 glycosylhydrolase [Bryobacteraceae bacterium]
MPVARNCTPAALAMLIASSAAAGQLRSEYRAFWVDTFNTPLNNHAEVAAVVDNAKGAKANAIFAQVRRRGDAWYLNALEPPPDFMPLAAGFDPLQDLIHEAHANGIEVHAFVIMGAIWNKNPTFAPTATLGPPLDPNHVFNLHGGYDPVTKTIIPGPNNWLTRTLLPDSSANGISFQGHRFGNDFWLDFGHPAAAAYTVDVLLHLIRNYDLDGLHLDRIRYPEFTASGQTPSTGTNIGYNAASVERFQRRHGIAAESPPPEPNDPRWSQWRRDQVTNVVRRLYLSAIAEKPQLKLSAALIAFGGGPATEAAWNSAEAYWRVYQDWRAWTEEGILDMAIPMNYKREHTPSQAAQYDTWNEWTKNHQYGRAVLIGQGAFLNAIEGTLRQTRRALAPSAAGNSVAGVTFYSMATSNAAVPANPFSVPAGQDTPARVFAEFACGLTTGKSLDGLTDYEDAAANAPPIFSEPASIPELHWKVSPAKGHIMGFARHPDGRVLDTADVTITDLQLGLARTTATDGGGYYGGVDLTPGSYLVRAELGADVFFSCVTPVVAGQVTAADLRPDRTAPVTTAAPTAISGWYREGVTVTLSASDDCTGVAATEYSLNGGDLRSWTGPVTITAEGLTTILYRSVDRAGNVEPEQTLVLRIDRSPPVVTLAADPTPIRAPDGNKAIVKLSGTASDGLSGLANVSYAVAGEYGAHLSIRPRALGGNSASWQEEIELEAAAFEDTDGRRYRIMATVTDVAGNSSTTVVDVVVPQDHSPELRSGYGDRSSRNQMPLLPHRDQS